ncbi:addiction module antidote protein [Candidatus Thiosymbion oneisti]|uniref:addiction module antidote protein n=1 Tax=Candidatus Thiosymbion oneisti TaxID=589554 RepID=UPI000A93C514|nr:addiction module antidote protein [Candidatus Thiosymbion oneisti]
MAEKFSRYDTANYLETEEDIRLYLEACQEDGDPTLIAAALSDIARAQNMSQLAKESGMTRAGLCQALSPGGNPSFATVSKVAKALGLKITIHPA